ncbi:hypothetical protein, partial [uncultured Alistipes sp.]|uniref:hypothetical protein n=1 Tax=uncultured Alistipes sp. TaxID=538949 RepID=UPI00265E33CB
KITQKSAILFLLSLFFHPKSPYTQTATRLDSGTSFQSTAGGLGRQSLRTAISANPACGRNLCPTTDILHPTPKRSTRGLQPSTLNTEPEIRSKNGSKDECGDKCGDGSEAPPPERQKKE